jgi:RNA recognition motif-containing protein
MICSCVGLGNIPGNTTPTSLQGIFAVFGTIESVRVLSHKNCGFINFESVESAIKARDALLSNEIAAQGFTGARVGFAKIPPPPTKQQNNNNVDGEESSSSCSSSNDQQTVVMDATTAWQNDLYQIMVQFNVQESVASSYVKGIIYTRTNDALKVDQLTIPRLEDVFCLL